MSVGLSLKEISIKKKLPPKTYRYDSSLSLALDWDGKNPAREQGEAQMADAESQLKELHQELSPKPDVWKEVAAHVGKAQESVWKLKAISKPFLNWAGKAQRITHLDALSPSGKSTASRMAVT